MKKITLSNYKAVILAGGKGTRLYPITLEIPKALLSIHRKPVINYLVELFLKQGVKEIAILINKDFSEDFIWWKKRYFPKEKISFFIEKKPLGTFGGLHLAKKWIGKSHFFLVNGDDLAKINLTKMAQFHEKTNPVGTIALVKVKNPADYGSVICNSDYIKDFIEKSQAVVSHYVNSGYYLLSPGIFKYHLGPEFLMIEKDIFPQIAKKEKLAGFKFQGKWIDTGTYDRYKEALKYWN